MRDLQIPMASFRSDYKASTESESYTGYVIPMAHSISRRGKEQ